MAKKGRNLMGGRNPKRKKAIDEAVGSAMAMPMKRPKARPATGMTSSPRPKARPPMATEAEIAAADRANKTVDRINKEGIPGMKAGGMMKKKGYAKGGMMKKGYKAGGKLKQPDADNVGLKKLPESVRNNMGYMAKGGMAKKGYAKGGMMKKGYKKGGKVRGAGIARKGVRPAKMRQLMDFDDEIKRMKDRAFKKDLEFQRKLNPDVDKVKQEAQVRKGVYGRGGGGGAMLDLTQRPSGMRLPPKKKLKAGGKIRGCGMASKGTRPVKMVRMKGS